MNIRIVIADDHRIVREGLKALIEQQKGLSVVGAAESGREAVSVVKETSPDVVVMDIMMPDMNGIEATRRIRSAGTSVKVLGLSAHTDSRFILEMMRAGASGYLTKCSAFDELTHAIRSVMSDHIYLSHTISDLVIQKYLDLASKGAKTVFTVLGSREREVLQLIAEGRSTKEIAALLGLSVKTVETYRQQVMEKLGMRSVAGLTRYAIREGLIALDS